LAGAVCARGEDVFGPDFYQRSSALLILVRAARRSLGVGEDDGVEASAGIRLPSRLVSWKARPVTVQLIRAPGLYAGVPYAYASIGGPAALVFTAGACPLGPEGEVVGPGDVRAQAHQVMANLAEALAAAGSSLNLVLKTTVFVASSGRADLVAAWEVVSAAFGVHDVPSTLLGVAALGWPGQLVEVEAVAVGADDRRG
jgi:enamine deaminase RidA (YjgF/YER057c/UK114 family)